jgi:hypothetical protein
MKNNINETLTFNVNSIVFIDNKTKGHKTLQKMLTKRSITWTSIPHKDVTYVVCTRYQCDKFYSSNVIYTLNPEWEKAPKDIQDKFESVNVSSVFIDSLTGHNSYNRWYNKKWNRRQFIGYIDDNGKEINKFIIDKSLNCFEGKRIYSYNEFKRCLENKNRVEIEDTEDSVLSLLKSKDDVNIKLAVTLIEQYKMDERWVPWLKLNQHIKEVRLLLRKLGLSYQGTYNKRSYIKDDIHYHIAMLDVPKGYEIDFIKALYQNE